MEVEARLLTLRLPHDLLLKMVGGLASIDPAMCFPVIPHDAKLVAVNPSAKAVELVLTHPSFEDTGLGGIPRIAPSWRAVKCCACDSDAVGYSDGKPYCSQHMPKVEPDTEEPLAKPDLS